jgi:hypothetical protein
MSNLVKYQGYKGMVICIKKEFFPPEAPSLSSGNSNLQHEIIPKNSKDATVDANLLSECKETRASLLGMTWFLMRGLWQPYGLATNDISV